MAAVGTILGVVMFILFIYGLLLAIRSNIILAIIALVMSPLAVIFGLGHLFARRDLAAEIMVWWRG